MRERIAVAALITTVLLLAAPVVLPVLGYGNPTMAKAQNPGGLQFDPTVTLGNLLTIGAFLLSLVAAWASFRARIEARLAVIEVKLDTIWRAWVQDHRRSDEP